MSWYVNFREKGPTGRFGGYLRCDTQEEVDEFVAQCREIGFGVYVEEARR